jgi:hypothetical protein
MIFQICHSLHAGTTGATKDIESIFYPVANDSGVAALAVWGKFVDGTLKTIERVFFTIHVYLKGSLVSIPAVVTSFHRHHLPYVSYLHCTQQS